jgi:hypothetical protein
MHYPEQDLFRAYCISNGYSLQYNDGLKQALENDLGVTGFSLPDLMRLYESVNGPDYLFP